MRGEDGTVDLWRELEVWMGITGDCHSLKGVVFRLNLLGHQ